ncbi:MAG: hypothetical protein HQL31_02330 [Planctomycetes bacterium]|nr:hypothetical protein [Planctomycetota bacterium]
MLLDFEKYAKKSERLKTMGELAGTVAHEVRTPLSALQGAVEIVVSSHTDAESREKFSKVIYEEIRRINDVIDGFLNLGRNVDISFINLPLDEFFEDCSMLLNPVFKKNNIRYSRNIPRHANVKAHGDQLKQVYLNLVMNAVAAIPPEGGEIKIDGIEEKGKLRLIFTDTGNGVKADIADRIFDPFVTGRPEGSGLGLYLSRNIIHSFGGDMFLEKSQPGHTEFHIILPLTTA